MNSRKELTVLCRGPGWAAVEKPPGMSVHNDPGRDVVSLLPGLLAAAEPGRSRPEAIQAPSPVHRLDRETSGVLLLGTDPEVLRFLSGQFARGLVSKTYAALVHGRVPDPDGPEALGIWDFPLSKTSGGRSDPAGRGPLLPSRTGFGILARSVRYTLLEVRLFTGRQHQIRRHAKLAGHPVAGDARYGSKRSIDWLRSFRGFSRLGLHALSLTFTPPEQPLPLTVVSRGMPSEFLDLLEKDPPA
jgi:23S rRNA-/tRNA-specific pseudouridylate synthase